jgi:hypothetical protein
MRPTDTELASGERETVEERPFSDDLKVQINTLIWMHAPNSTTLGDAEALAVHIMNAIYAGRKP